MKGIYIMKKLLSFIMAALVLLSTTAFAEILPKIYTSSDREICLDVPQGKFVDGVFMAPVRRVCEIFDASCDWYSENQSIIINSKDNVTRIFLYIGNPTIRVFTFTGVISGSGENFPLEAPIEIVNDRTMVPFEQLCKALKGECVWNEDKTEVLVKVAEADAPKKAEIYLTQDKEDVAAGDEVTITVMGKNLDIMEQYGFSGLSTAVIFDKAAFEHVSTDITDADGNLVKALKFENKEFTNDSVKTVTFATEPFAYGDEEVKIGKIVLKALTDKGGEVKLSNRIYTIGSDTELVYMDKSGESLASVNKGTELSINTSPVIIK